MGAINFGAVETSTGRLVSTSEFVMSGLPGGFISVTFDPPLDIRTEMWNEALFTIGNPLACRVARPAKVFGDIYDDLIAALQARGINLNASARTIAKQALRDIIGEDRFYNAAIGWVKR